MVTSDIRHWLAHMPGRRAGEGRGGEERLEQNPSTWPPSSQDAPSPAPEPALSGSPPGVMKALSLATNQWEAAGLCPLPSPKNLITIGSQSFSRAHALDL